MKRIVLFIVMFVIFPLSFLFAEEKGSVVQKLDKGEIDWEHLVIRVVGIGGINPDIPEAVQRPNAIRAAKMDAYRNLLEIVQGVSITSETTVENMMLKDDVINSKVHGILRGFKIEGKPRYMSDSTVEITISYPITGELARLMLPLYDKEKPLPKIEGNVNENEKAKEYTGIIIDAREFTVLPCMAPKILTDDNTPIYDTSYVNPDYAVKMGVVGYAKSLDTAKKDERVASNPLVIKAIKVAGNSMDIYISKDDAAKITNNQNIVDNIKKCKVMILIK